MGRAHHKREKAILTSTGHPCVLSHDRRELFIENWQFSSYLFESVYCAFLLFRALFKLEIGELHAIHRMSKLPRHHPLLASQQSRAMRSGVFRHYIWLIEQALEIRILMIFSWLKCALVKLVASLFFQWIY